MIKPYLNVIDLFCGCGGLSFGFMQAGYNIILGIDNDNTALKTFKANHNGSETLCLDLHASSSIDDIKKALGNKKPDIVVAGPPCQGFSLTGPRKFDDKRNSLYLAVIKTVRTLKPKAFLIENVPGLANLYNGKIKDKIIQRFNKIGYNVSMKILTAADYGIPQIRKRVFFVGLKKTYGSFDFPAHTRLPKRYITCEEAISDLPARENELGHEIDNYINLPATSYQKKMRGKYMIV